MLQDRIKKNEEYFRGMEMSNGIVIIKVQYGDRWGTFNGDDDKIKVVKSETNPNEWFYYADANEVDFEDIFDLIEKTIEMNLSVSAKIELLREKVDELKQIFSNESLAKLKTLKFVMNDVSDKPKKRKYTRRKKEISVSTDSKENNEIIEE
jgi:hypothetical protein